MVSADDVRRAYDFFLGRPAEDDAAVRYHQSRARRRTDLFQNLVGSEEFHRRWDPPPPPDLEPTELPDEDVVRRFEAHTGPGEPGFVTDFLGTRTRTSYLNWLAAHGGAVEWYPFPKNCLFPLGEWAAALRSVLEAGPRFVMAELGAGWGPWSVICAAACRRRGIAAVRLIAAEASSQHFTFLLTHFRDNGLDPADHRLFHGVVAPRDGWAEFPDLEDPTGDYGASVSPVPLSGRAPPGCTARVQAFSLETLLAPVRRVDHVHMDIQGAEAEVVSAGRSVLRTKVHRILVGTHSRAIEQELFATFAADGWILEADEPCQYAQGAGGLSLHADGCQVWRNPAV